MNRIRTTSHRATRLQAASAVALVALIALTGAAWMTLTVPDDGPAIERLERVVVEGRRTNPATVVQLPRVVVQGRRVVDGEQVAATGSGAVR